MPMAAMIACKNAADVQNIEHECKVENKWQSLNGTISKSFWH